MIYLKTVIEMNWDKFIAWGRQDPSRASVYVAIFITFLIAVISYLRNNLANRNVYTLETLKRNGFANDHTEIRRSWSNGAYIFKPNKTSMSFSDNLALLSELFNDDKFVGVRFEKKSIIFEKANFSGKGIFKFKRTSFLFSDQNGKQFEPEDHTLILMVRSGGGKTSFLRAYILAFLEKHRNGEVVISDPHGSFASLSEVAGINIFDSGTMEGKKRLLEKIKEGREYQRSINLGHYETLGEAWRADDVNLKGKKPWLFVVDEMLESFSTASSKDEAYQLNQDLIKNLQHLVTSARKYQQYILVATQANLVSQLQIHQNLFHAAVFGHMNEDTTSLKGLPLNLPVLKRLGVFYYTSKFVGARFIKVRFVSKNELNEKARQVKSDKTS
ncbi:hypothetical protein [Bdellovibrio sp. GT3]|uniref:hypothetical protein n=1 Tax=Bdellovibrio sp. GT3 TaxID=3136282 RepID=UPI0030F0E667